MNLVQRATAILKQPRSEWSRVDDEAATVGSLFAGYALPVAALATVGAVIGGVLFADNVGNLSPTTTRNFMLANAGLDLVIRLIAAFAAGLIANALAPRFGGERNRMSAMKLVVYSATAGWVAGLFNFIPVIGPIIALLGFAYSIYLFYLGSTPLVRVPTGRAAGYTAAVMVPWFIIYVLLAGILGALLAVAMFGVAALSNALQI